MLKDDRNNNLDDWKSKLRLDLIIARLYVACCTSIMTTTQKNTEKVQ
jgi:hypothetical protein